MKVVLGVCGGIAAYKSLELVRLFVKEGHTVQVVMTEGAKQFIQPLSFQALSGHPVRDSLFDPEQEAGMGHIELARWADVIVIAPATAESLAKLRVGRADDLITTVCLATDRPILVAPAMNRLMWQNAATQENVTLLMQRGFELLSPGVGEQACGEVGEGRMPEPLEIFEAAKALVANTEKNHQAWLDLAPKMANKRILISAGPTHEPIDPVRFIGNRSSGKMGYALAEVAAKLGAQVTLISGPVALPTPLNTEKISVKTALEMFEAVKTQYASQDVFISAAAVADFRVQNVASQKLKKTADTEDMSLQLVKNPDIVAWVAQQKDKPKVIGFAAETEQVLTYAKNKRAQKNLDMICANQVGDGQGFETEYNQLTLITANQQKAIPQSSKRSQAFAVFQFMADNALL